MHDKEADFTSVGRYLDLWGDKESKVTLRFLF